MPVHPITRDEFDAYQPHRAPDSDRLYEEVEWFADERGNVLGFIVRDRTDNDWSWVVMGRDERDIFRAIELEASLLTRAEAKTKLLAAMGRVEGTGEIDFPQDDSERPFAPGDCPSMQINVPDSLLPRLHLLTEAEIRCAFAVGLFVEEFFYPGPSRSARRRGPTLILTHSCRPQNSYPLRGGRIQARLGNHRRTETSTPANWRQALAGSAWLRPVCG